MDEFFANLLTVSIQGSVVILAVMLLRLVLKKAPKRAICLLWLLAGLRLLVPIQIETNFSLQPRQEDVTVSLFQQSEIFAPAVESETGWGEILDNRGDVLLEKPVTSQSTGQILDSQGNILIEKPVTSLVQDKTWQNVLVWIWLAGVLAMGISSVTAFCKLKRRVSDGVILEEGVWICRNVDTAFVLGFFNPQIYLPVWLNGQDREFVLDHERSHIARHDQWWKLLGYITLSIHWFNPLVWMGYSFLCRDLEMACDENVVKAMDLARRKAYSAALVSGSVVHRTITACPVAFGEVSVKERVKHVLNFRKPGVWVTALALVAAAFVAVFLLTSPGEEEILRAGYRGPGEEYEYYHESQREAAWEEDILFLAENLLAEHPRVSTEPRLVHSGIELKTAEYSSEFYDSELRSAVIDKVDTLIPKLAEMSDDQVYYEMKAILALMDDLLTTFVSDWSEFERIQLLVEPIYDENGVSLYAIRVPESMAHLTYGKLTAINNFSIQTVIDRTRPYVSCENDYRLLNQLTSMWNSPALLYTKAMLVTIGAVEPDADTVTLTFETEQGTETAVFPFVTNENYWDESLVNVSLLYTDQPQFRHLGKEFFWYEILEEEQTLYANLWYMTDNNSRVHMGQFLAEVAQKLENSQEELKLVLDFRYSGATYNWLQEIQSFADRVNRANVEGVYILVDGSVKDLATVTAYWLKAWINGAQIVGSPTGSGVNLMSNDYRYILPNSEHVFWIANQVIQVNPDSDANTLVPDILIYQTLEDYRNGLDTVFEAVVNGDVGKETTLAPLPQKESNIFIDVEDIIDVVEMGKVATVRSNGYNRVLINKCIAALEALQARDAVHLTAEATYFDIPGETGSYQEYWQSGSDWMRIGEQYFEDSKEDYTVGNLCLEDTQYRFGHAGKYGIRHRNWTVAEDKQLWNAYWLMDFDLSEARVLTLETWETEDGCAIRMELGRKIDTGVYGTQYRRTHTYFLDAEGKLLRLVEDADYEPLNPAAIKEDRRLRVEICVMDTAEGEITEKLQTAQMELLQ